MPCKFDQDLLQQYVDGTIGHLERVFADEHLKVCPRCQTLARELNFIAECFVSLHLPDARIDVDLDELVRHTVEIVCTESSKINVLSLLRQQRDVASCAMGFMQYVPGTKALAAVGKKSLQLAPKALWRVSRGLYVGGTKLAKVLA
ncbi:MAG: zf-HC2 domain-containing protein [Bacillota bacterium]|nr:zf-HC2 domain-containing protein [Bacillota bacterium]